MPKKSPETVRAVGADYFQDQRDFNMQTLKTALIDGALLTLLFALLEVFV